MCTRCHGETQHADRSYILQIPIDHNVLLDVQNMLVTHLSEIETIPDYVCNECSRSFGTTVAKKSLFLEADDHVPETLVIQLIRFEYSTFLCASGTPFMLFGFCFETVCALWLTAPGHISSPVLWSNTAGVWSNPVLAASLL